MKLLVSLSLVLFVGVLWSQPSRAQDSNDKLSAELQCEEADPKITAAEIKKIEQSPFFDELSFECWSDWLHNEFTIATSMRELDERSYLEFEDETNDDKEHLALRNIVLAYETLSVVRSLDCVFDKSGTRKKAIGGQARFHKLWATRASDVLGTWQLKLSANDCEFIEMKMGEHSPEDIVHNKEYGSAELDDGTIILVHGRSLKEYYNEYGDIHVVMIPGLVKPSSPVSESNEAALETVLDYFTQKAFKEGKQTREFDNELADRRKKKQ